MRLLALLLLATVPLVGQTTHYVRAGASGAANGTNWTDAYTALPATLTRGDTYYIADGTYSPYVFNDAVSGTAFIYIKKATGADHGTETGWDNSYGDGVAAISTSANGGYCFEFATGYYDIEGGGGGSDSWEAGHGFDLSYSGGWTNIYGVKLSNGTGTVSNVRLSGLKIAGPGVTPGEGTGIFNNLNSIDNITIENCWITGTGQGLIRVYHMTDSVIRRCALTDTAPANAQQHGSGITLWQAPANVDICFNRFRAVIGTGWIGGYQITAGNTQSNIRIYGNVFYGVGSESTNGVIYSSVGGSGAPDWDGWAIHHNTFYGVGNLPLIAHYGSETNCAVYNNTAYNCPGTFVNGIATEANNVKQVSDIFVDGANGNLHLTQETATNGTALGSPYNVDMDGVTRGQGSSWDIGAFEYVAGGGGGGGAILTISGALTIGP